MKKFRYLWIVGIIIADQLLKLYIRNSMYVGQSIPVIRDVLHITYVQNRGGAFSILSGHGMILIIIPLAAIAAAIWYMEKHKEAHWSLFCALCLIIAGGVGNLADRIALGYVTDMLDFRFFPVFNIADISVCVGAGFMILYTFAFSPREEKRQTEDLAKRQTD